VGREFIAEENAQAPQLKAVSSLIYLKTYCILSAMLRSFDTNISHSTWHPRGGEKMRKILALDFTVEFVSLVALIIAITLAWVGYVLDLSIAVVVTASIGITLSANMLALKWWIRREINKTMTLFKLLESIDDEALYERGKTAIEECRIVLENLSQGLLRLDPKSYMRDLIEMSNSARRHIRLTHVGLDDKHMELINPVAENRWYQNTLRLIQRGIQVERIFIIPRSGAMDGSSGKIRTDLADTLIKQVEDGTLVYLVWEEKIDVELIQEFMIIDRTLVLSSFATWSGSAFADWKLSRRRHDVAKFIEIFDSLIAQGHLVSELDELLP
jgi:hypothetical protein